MLNRTASARLPRDAGCSNIKPWNLLFPPVAVLQGLCRLPFTMSCTETYALMQLSDFRCIIAPLAGCNSGMGPGA